MQATEWYPEAELCTANLNAQSTLSAEVQVCSEHGLCRLVRNVQVDDCSGPADPASQPD